MREDADQSSRHADETILYQVDVIHYITFGPNNADGFTEGMEISNNYVHSPLHCYFNTFVQTLWASLLYKYEMFTKKIENVNRTHPTIKYHTFL